MHRLRLIIWSSRMYITTPLVHLSSMSLRNTAYFAIQFSASVMTGFKCDSMNLWIMRNCKLQNFEWIFLHIVLPNLVLVWALFSSFLATSDLLFLSAFLNVGGSGSYTRVDGGQSTFALIQCSLVLMQFLHDFSSFVFWRKIAAIVRSCMKFYAGSGGF